jgi:phenylalanyl-tRNA synthetase beta subunit
MARSGVESKRRKFFMIHNINNLGIKELREILDRQNYKCALTGRPLTPDNCAMDHIVPLSRGGKIMPSL